jgi:hypothetical protein
VLNAWRRHGSKRKIVYTDDLGEFVCSTPAASWIKAVLPPDSFPCGCHMCSTPGGVVAQSGAELRLITRAKLRVLNAWRRRGSKRDWAPNYS